MARQESEALGLFSEEHGAQITVALAHVSLLGHRAGNAERLQADTDGFRRVRRGLAALLNRDRAAKCIRPSGVFKRDG